MKNGKISPLHLRYLISIFRLSEDGVAVRNSELSNALDANNGTVYKMVNNMQKNGMVKTGEKNLVRIADEMYPLIEKFVYCYDMIEYVLKPMYDDKKALDMAICKVLSDISPKKLDELCSMSYTDFINLRDPSSRF